MVIRPHDAGTEEEWKALLDRHRFGLLIAPGRDRVRRKFVDGSEQRRGPGDREASEHLTRRHPPA
jgi:hypothetical protein